MQKERTYTLDGLTSGMISLLANRRVYFWGRRVGFTTEGAQFNVGFYDIMRVMTYCVD